VVRDIGLADLFVQNASAQLHGAQAAIADAASNRALHSTAIAIELLLKSYLLRIATNDDWNRINCQRRSKSRPLGGVKSGHLIRALASAGRA
jgi:hypothetical protein